MQQGDLRSDRGSWFINEFFLKFAFFNIHDIFKAGNCSSHIFLKLACLTIHNISDCVKRKWIDKKGETRAGKIPIPQLCQVNMSQDKNGETRWLNQSKSQS